MRVITGSAKGKRLKYPSLTRGRQVRPLSDQVKESLFNILMDRVEGCYFLDLFAGSGAVGIEALSRGAKLCFFVELERKAVGVIRENLESTRLRDNAEVYCMDVLRAIKLFKKKGAQFDNIFLGAPYGSPVLEKALNMLGTKELLKENGLVIAEHRAKTDLAQEYEGLKQCRQARYGDTVLTFYE